MKRSAAVINMETGYVALMGVIIISAACLAGALTLLIGATDANRTAVVSEKAVSATSYAHSCGEEALQQIRDDTTYTVSGSLTFSGGSCSYTITNTGGSNRTIASTGTAGDAVRKISISATIGASTISTSSWQEVNN